MGFGLVAAVFVSASTVSISPRNLLLSGLKLGDPVKVPGDGLRLQRTVMSSRDKGALFEDTLKNHRSRTVPLVAELVPVNEKWSEGKQLGDWLFHAPMGGPLSEPNWKSPSRDTSSTRTFGTLPRRSGARWGHLSRTPSLARTAKRQETARDLR